MNYTDQVSTKEWTRHSLEKLILDFEFATLPKESWTHQSHLLVAFWYLYTFPIDDAIKKIREGIIKYNKATGVENSDTRGYHETLTLFWVQIVKRYIESCNSNLSISEMAIGLIKNSEINSGLPLQFYTKSLLFSTKARKSWVEPDLKTLD